MSGLNLAASGTACRQVHSATAEARPEALASLFLVQCQQQPRPVRSARPAPLLRRLRPAISGDEPPGAPRHATAPTYVLLLLYLCYTSKDNEETSDTFSATLPGTRKWAPIIQLVLVQNGQRKTLFAVNFLGA